MAVVTAEIVLEVQGGLAQAGPRGGRPPTLLPAPRGGLPTIRCLYSSEASCTPVSHALGPLA